ncbi:Coiled coil DNA-binding membrane protein [Ditylenchus destructor]|uniref:Coiled coil DNA-binding membrane protein n=1 Tax=Ditylenchus destructor TaxID=166010 RepID=A0AAD4R1Q6_9BILA|nr:Coiled coil DNA-binding membrane protein [Ditylenchus destructor]
MGDNVPLQTTSEIKTNSVRSNRFQPFVKRSSFDELFYSAISTALLAVVFACRIIFDTDLREKRRLQALQDSLEPSSVTYYSNFDDEGTDEWHSLSTNEDAYSSTACLDHSDESQYWDAMSSDGRQRFQSENSSTNESEDESHAGMRNTSTEGQPRGVSHLLATDILPSAGSNSSPPRPSTTPPPPPGRVDTSQIPLAEEEESPPIVIRTLGVQRDAAAHAAAAQALAAAQAAMDEERAEREAEEEEATWLEHDQGHPYGGYMFFGSGSMPSQIEVDIPPLGFLDAIIEEDSDDLRSGQSSRGSSNRFGTGRAPSQTAAPEVDARFVEILKEEEVDSDGVEITELPSESSASVKGSEEESVKEEAEEVATPTVMVPASDQYPSFSIPEDGRVSSTSMSINLDRSRDSLLDQSVCSNPRDESNMLASSSATAHGTSTSETISADSRKRRAAPDQSEKASSTSSDEDEEALPPPPPQSSSTPAGDSQQAADVVAQSVVAGIKELQSPPPTETAKITEPAAEKAPVKTVEAERPEIQPVRPISGNTERIASFVYGYGGIGAGAREGQQETPKSPLLWSTSRLRHITGDGDSNKENTELLRESSRTRTVYTSQPFDEYSTKRISPYEERGRSPFDSVSPQHIFSSYEMRRRQEPESHFGHRAYDSIKPFYGTTLDNKSDMDLQPPTEPPPPPPAKSFAEGGSAAAGEISRDDIISEGHRSRSTVREIPIQRSASAFAPAVGGMASIGGGTYTTGTGAPLPITTTAYTSAGRYPPAEEYYRREVLTRTLVTRSTEALSGPPLSRSSPINEHLRQIPEPPRGDELTEEYWYKYSRNVEEEERRIRENQDKRRKEEEERRQREEENRRRWEQQEQERLERLRRERERIEKEFDIQAMERERLERERVEKDRVEREAAELRRRKEWERLENERRQYEENELEKRRQLERLEKERLERERLEKERLELERLERERLRLEELERERMERERIERERIEIERLEIERIERIKREQKVKEEREKQRQREEAERLEKERLEAERIRQERLELERRERELIEIQRREAEQRERERREDELREQRRRQQEQRERELLEQAEREAAEREMQRKLKEKMEQERLENLRREQERLEFEKIEAERRERQRQEEERREQELLEAQIRARERREKERLEEGEREFQRQEEERREQERRQRERLEAQERERQRLIEEQRERERIAALEAAAVERRAQRMEEERRNRDLLELERRAEEIKEIERREAEKRERERLEEERRLAELRDLERRNAEKREAERREAAEREMDRRREDRRSRDRLDIIAKEREERERWEMEKNRLIAEREAQERKRQALTSKETLEKLTRKPYYSRENLSSVGLPEVTTKVERQIIERVDRTLWTSDGLIDPRYGGTQQQSLTYSGNAHQPSLLDTSDSGGAPNGAYRDRIYNPRDDDYFRRGGSTRTSKYKAKMEKARREFLQADPSAQSDPLGDRFRKSTEDLGRKIEYRGPLLQKFNSGEFSSARAADLDSGLPPPSYSRMGPSPYDQEYRRLFDKAERSLSQYRERLSQPNLYGPRDRHFSVGPLLPISTTTEVLRHETNLDDVHRSKSVLDYNSTRYSRKDGLDSEPTEQHSRSKSADYLLDRRIREESGIPENELQKSVVEHRPYSPERRQVSEHEYIERFRKSVEKLHVPEWYREYGQGERPSDLMGPATTTTATSGIFSGTSGPSYSRYEGISPTASVPLPYTSNYQERITTTRPSGWYGAPLSEPFSESRLRSPSSPVGGIAFPPGMFDKYKDEIEDLRRSRTSLHQIPATTAQEHTKDPVTSGGYPTEETTAITREYTREAFSKTDIRTTPGDGRQQSGYTVSTVPADWNIPRERLTQNSRVVEVADTFIGKPDSAVNKTGRYGGRITVEEVLDSIFQQIPPSHEPVDPSLPQFGHPPPQNVDGPGIYTTNYVLMDKVMEQPHLAESLLQKEPLFIRCSHCQKTRSLREARGQYVSCKHCYSYYCSRQCRQLDWERHRDRCSFARINTLCKEVIMKVRRDPETQYHMSKVARDGYRRVGRGSVNIRLISAHSAQMYLKDGWKVFDNHDPNQLLFYYSIQSLIDQRKEPSLIQLCRKYNPSDKFILSVSIIADIEQCPETPPPEPISFEPSHHVNTTTYTHYNQSPSLTSIQPQVYSAIVPTNV